MRISLLILYALALSATGSHASAERRFFECNRSSFISDTARLEEFSNDILSGKIVPDSNVEGAWAAKCLEAATGKPYTFDISTKSFSAKTDEEIRAENEERKRISEEAEARKREQERRDAELLKAHGDEERRLECSLTLAEKNLRTAEYRVNAAKGQRSRETEKMVQTTCEKLYRRDRREAILNPICLSVFREFGLPDSSVEINATRDELLDARLQVLQARRQLQEFRGYKLESSITSENEVGDCEYLLNTDE